MKSGIDFSSDYHSLYDDITNGNMCLYISLGERTACEQQINGLSKQGVFALLMYIQDQLLVEFNTLSQLETLHLMPARKQVFLLNYLQSKHQKIGSYIYYIYMYIL